MKVYHGSNSNFKQLKISKSLVKHNSTLDNEGIGIYFTTDKETARSYGKYLYTLEINNKYLKDFRQYGVCEKYIHDMARTVAVVIKYNFLHYISRNEIEMLISRMQLGGQVISRLSQDIELILDNNEAWYTRVPKQRREKAYSVMRNFEKNNLVIYMFRYNIDNVGVIKNTSPNIVKIVSKEPSY